MSKRKNIGLTNEFSDELEKNEEPTIDEFSEELEDDERQTTHERKRYKKRRFHIIGLLLSIASNSLTIFTTLFGYISKIAPRLSPVLTLLSLFSDSVVFIYHFIPFLLKSMPLKVKISLATAAIATFVANSIPNVTTLLSYITSVAEVITGLNPILFFIGVAIPTYQSAMGLYDVAKDYIQKPWTHTPETKLRLATRSVKTAALVTMSGVMIPLIMATGGILITATLVNPFTAGPAAAALVSIFTVAVVVLVTMKVIKIYAQRRVQEKEAELAVEQDISPYEVLGIAPSKLNALTKEERVKNLQNQYEWKESLILRNEEGYSEEIKQRKLSENYRAYELLKSPWATDMYQTFKVIHDGNKDKPYPSPEKTLKITSPLLAYRPISWIHYLVQRYDASEEKQKKLDIAYKILTNSALYAYQKKMEIHFHAKQTESETKESSSGILRGLSYDKDRVMHKEKRNNPLHHANDRQVKRSLPLEKKVVSLGEKEEKRQDRKMRRSI
jgi:hypothetical protein